MVVLTLRKRSGESVPRSLTMPVRPSAIRIAATSWALAFGYWVRTSAAAPATCGAAIEVPERVIVSAGPVIEAASIDEPGAKRSTQEPILEK